MSLFFTLALALLSSHTYFHPNPVQCITLDLIHRDSPKSPLYNPSETRLKRVRHALRRSIHRANYFRLAAARGSSASNESRIISGGGEYLLNISIGTPPVEIVGIADTGSDLTWTQCKPCSDCYPQKAPLYDTSRSSSYKAIPCGAQECRILDTTECGGVDNRSCQYTVQYGDQSYTIGVLAADSLAIGVDSAQSISLSQGVFGCGFSNEGNFDSNSSGIIGLGAGDVSMITQMKTLIGGQFSYCLGPPFPENVSSKISFGRDAAVSGPGTATTPMLNKPGPASTFYYVHLESFTVGNKRVPFSTGSSIPYGGEIKTRPRSMAGLEGNIILDSGTTMTILPSGTYKRLVDAVSKQIKLERVETPVEQDMQLCYKSSSSHGFEDAPVITAHFAGGADVKLSGVNTFVKMGNETVCFTFVEGGDTAIFGNLAQINLLVGYDLNAKTVSFKPADCTKP